MLLPKVRGRLISRKLHEIVQRNNINENLKIFPPKPMSELAASKDNDKK